MAATPRPDAVAASIGRQLAAAADPAVRVWWERYLKGSAQFVGVRMADIRRIVRTAVAEHPGAAGDLDLALGLIARRPTEEKLAGVLLIAEHGLDALASADVDRLAAPLAAGHLADWNSCDWYCVKALAGFVTSGPDPEARMRAVSGWRAADGLWQRRAAAVTFTRVAAGPEPFDGFTDLMLEVCARNARDPARWSQTGAGWLLRELSRQAPDAVRAFVARTPQLSPEARRTALARIG